MEVNSESREKFIAVLKKLIGDKSKDVEMSVYDFSLEYAKTNDTPFLIDNIYENKSEEIVCLLENKDSDYLVKAIKFK